MGDPRRIQEAGAGTALRASKGLGGLLGQLGGGGLLDSVLRRSRRT
jgi:hypothetical protein